jgi:hypothetical protein
VIGEEKRRQVREFIEAPWPPIPWELIPNEVADAEAALERLASVFAPDRIAIRWTSAGR